MKGVIFACLSETDFVENTTLLSTILAFLSLLVVISFGLKLNHRFLVKLREEKRARPLGRKGNVIEPIASLFCILQIIYWPYNILFMWVVSNQIFPSDFWIGWHSTVLWNLGIKLGRTYVACNSFFTSLIRYIYIVHHDRSNQWEFEKVGKLFCLASLVLPITIETLGVFTSDMAEVQSFWSQHQFADCIASYLSVNSTTIEIPYPPDALQWTMTILPESAIDVLWFIYISCNILIYTNVVESILYLRIFQTIKRSNMESHTNGVLSDAMYEYDKKRSVISLKMCIMGLIYELISNIFVAISPIFKFKYECPTTYFVDPITMFVGVPFLYLFNDDRAKEIVINESWYQGIKYVLGVYVVPVEEQDGENPDAGNVMRGAQNLNHFVSNNNQRHSPSSTNNGFPSKQHCFQFRRYNSLPDIRCDSRFKRQKLKLTVLRKHLSCPGNSFHGTEVTENSPVEEIKSMRKNYSLSGSDSSLKTLNID